MIETADFCRVLASRMSLSGYGGVTIHDETAVHASTGNRDIFIYVWGEGAMSIVFPRGGDRGLHLNYWSIRGESPRDPVKAMWDQFWKHEKENRELGRPLWMHGSKLSVLESGDISPFFESSGEDDVFSMFGGSPGGRGT